MDKEKAIQTLLGIYNILQTIPVSGEQHIGVMAGIFQALKELGEWANEVREDEKVGDNNDKVSN